MTQALFGISNFKSSLSTRMKDLQKLKTFKSDSKPYPITQISSSHCPVLWRGNRFVEGLRERLGHHWKGVMGCGSEKVDERSDWWVRIYKTQARVHNISSSITETVAIKSWTGILRKTKRIPFQSGLGTGVNGNRNENFLVSRGLEFSFNWGGVKINLAESLTLSHTSTKFNKYTQKQNKC